MSREIVWSRVNLKELLPETPSPLGISFLEGFSSIWDRQYGRMGMKVPPGTQWIRVFRGRPYFNATALFQVMTEYGGDPEMFERALGGSQTEYLKRGLQEPGVMAKLKKFPALGKCLLLLRNIDNIAAETWKVYEGIYRNSPDLPSLSDRELLDHSKAALEKVREVEITLILGGLSGPFFHNSRKLLGGLEIEDADDLSNRLYTGLGDLVSANQNLEIMALADRAENEGLLEDLSEKDAYERLAGTDFRVALDAFLDRYGHRAVYETDPAPPRYKDDPALVVGLIREYARAGLTDPEGIRQRQARAREKAEDEVRGLMERQRFPFLKKRMLAYNLSRGRRFTYLREGHRHHLAMIMAHVRQWALEAGRRMAERGMLQEQEDIFFLTLPEIQGYLDGKEKDYHALVVARKKEMEENARVKVPDVFVGDEPIIEERNETDLFKGFGSSPGTVRGKASLVRSPEDFEKFRQGDILVAPATDPQWTFLFPMAAAVVTEMGGIGSHASIVAREFGVPCVVNARGVMDLEDGETIEVDGKRGTVRRVPA